MSKYNKSLPNFDEFTVDIFIQKAKQFSWPLGTDSKKYNYSTGSRKPEFTDALYKAFPKYKGKSEAYKKGASCSVFIATIVRITELDKSFLPSKTLEMMQKRTDLWEPISKTNIQAGDIVYYPHTGGYHILMYGGLQSNSKHLWYQANANKQYPYTFYGSSINAAKYKKASIFRPKKSVKNYIELNDVGTQPKLLQEFLNWYGEYNLVLDGIIGAKSEKAIKDFQTKENLVVDGKFGIKCLERAKLIDKTPIKDTNKEENIMITKAIDISYWQGKVSRENFEKVKKDGIKSVIQRSGYTSQSKFSLNTDSTMINNIINAAAAGLNVGIYHYSQAISVSEAKKEAEFCLNTIKKYKSYINLPVFFDWEWGGRLSASKASKLGKSKCTEICNAFCKVIKDAGYDTGVYASLSVFNGYLNPSSIDDKYLIWVAQYNNTCSYTRKKYMWQYSSSGSVKGLSGRIDMNYLYGDTPTPAPVPQPIIPGAIKVDGIWGADTTRKIQEKFGLNKDGIISSQPKSCKKYLSACSTSSWKFVTVSKGSATVKAMQRWLKVSADGKMGPKTIKALQKKLGVGVDGYCGSKTVRALQNYLNN